MALTVGLGEDNYIAGHAVLAYHYGLQVRPGSLNVLAPSAAAVACCLIIEVQMRAYEGGPDTSGPNLGPQYLAVKGDATVDPRMQPAVTTYLQNWCVR